VGDGGSEGSFADATEFGEWVVLATPGVVTGDVIGMAGPERFAGKIVIDATNPLDHSSRPPTLTVGHADSGGE